ncbi:low molecular weight protein-tyrosine-phosphatase [Novispirillum itersonii]|uniref:protein-tyrosine-phosphatase n=1 Tax=Novispirillum itersonii TaxID=189 RepID=A0A7W9ZGZ0_NOVIT|nr:low molecular weight protein-tyrosine-phosphatase [Novispirillum itersonii]MBB6209874.1 protein-tyrosine phosphatase [Novispirillum itersonii]
MISEEKGFSDTRCHGTMAGFTIMGFPVPAADHAISSPASAAVGRPVRVLFVCTGNICRSPSAEGFFRALVEREGLSGVIETDSAGTGNWHVGDPPDRRSQAAARRRGVELAELKARKVELADFRRFDLIIAMDQGHLAALRRMVPAEQSPEVVTLFLSYLSDPPMLDVPDPYYGGETGFEYVLDLIENGCAALLNHIRQRYPQVAAASRSG